MDPGSRLLLPPASRQWEGATDLIHRPSPINRLLIHVPVEEDEGASSTVAVWTGGMKAGRKGGEGWVSLFSTRSVLFHLFIYGVVGDRTIDRQIHMSLWKSADDWRSGGRRPSPMRLVTVYNLDTESRPRWFTTLCGPSWSPMLISPMRSLICGITNPWGSSLSMFSKFRGGSSTVANWFQSSARQASILYTELWKKIYHRVIEGRRCSLDM